MNIRLIFFLSHLPLRQMIKTAHYQVTWVPWRELFIIIIFSLRLFSHQQTLTVYHWSLSDSKSPQVSRTLLSILAGLNNAVVWTVSTILLLLLLLLLLLFTPLEFITSVLADGFSQKLEWQQVSSSLQYSSQDSGRSQQCCRLDSLYPSANFQVLQAF